MHTPERLRSYYSFDEDILDRVAETAEAQNNFHFETLAAAYEVADGPKKVSVEGNPYPFEVLDLKPNGEHDEHYAKIYHLPLGHVIGKAAAMQAIRLFGADPPERLILFGNPGGPGNNVGKLSARALYEAAYYKSLRLTVEPHLRYLVQLGITSVSHVGYSYGADKAVTAMGLTADYDQEALAGVLVESAATEDRGRFKIAKSVLALGQAARSLGWYKQQTESMPYFEALDDDESRLGSAGFAAGFLRPSNIAIGSALVGAHFPYRVWQALHSQPDSRVSIGWGTRSEFCSDENLMEITANLQQQFGPERVKTMRLINMHHAGIYDIDLMTAIVLQGLKDCR